MSKPKTEWRRNMECLYGYKHGYFTVDSLDEGLKCGTVKVSL